MLKNVTEMLAEQKLELIWSDMDCCKCRKCKEDILAYALSNLPARYVSTDSGELFVKLKMLSKEYDFEILRELAKAIKIVGENPHHS